MKKLLVILLTLSSPGAAQTVWTSPGPSGNMCCANGSCWMEIGAICHANPVDRSKYGEVIGNPGVTTSATPAPKCPAGYSLILRSLGDPACARDVIEPQ